MVKGIKKLTIIGCVLLVVLIAVNVFVYFADGMFDDIGVDNKLEDYDVSIELTSDGSAIITESHNVMFKERERDWWNYFKVIGFDSLSKTSIDMSSLKFKVDGVEYPVLPDGVNFDNESNLQYHNRYKGNAYYYDKGNAIEIGVVMPDFIEGRRRIEMSYTLNNILEKGTDIASFYYKIVDENNTMPIDALHCTITFPENSTEYLRTWLHITGAYGTTTIDNNSKISIVAKDIPTNTYVETRTTLDLANYSAFAKYTNDTFVSIGEQEAADFDASEKQNQKLKLFIVIDVVVGVVIFLVCLVYAIKDFIAKKRHHIDNAPTYLHEPPQDFDMEEAMPILHYYDEDDNWWSDVISGTIMNLVRKKYLTIMPGEKKKSAKLLIVNNDRDSLKSYEKIVMEMLDDASNGGMLSMKDFEDWCKVHYLKADHYIDDYKRLAKERAYSDRLMVHGNKRPSKRGFVITIVSIVLSALSFFGTNPLFIANILIGAGGLSLFILDNLRYIPLRKAGERQYCNFNAFKQFMLDFSSFDRKEIPELALWEEYMVWATGMGIADKVSEQLSIVYPEIDERLNAPNSFDNDIFFWYMYSPSFRHTFNVTDTIRGSISSVRAIKVQAAIDKASKSVGGGGGSRGGFGGGSFSGGGGGFSGGSMGSR